MVWALAWPHARHYTHILAWTKWWLCCFGATGQYWVGTALCFPVPCFVLPALRFVRYRLLLRNSDTIASLEANVVKSAQPISSNGAAGGSRAASQPPSLAADGAAAAAGTSAAADGTPGAAGDNAAAAAAGVAAAADGGDKAAAGGSPSEGGTPGGTQLVAAQGNAWRGLLNLIMQLRKIVNHPFMMPDSEPRGDGTSTLQELIDASGG